MTLTICNAALDEVKWVRVFRANVKTVNLRSEGRLGEDHVSPSTSQSGTFEGWALGLGEGEGVHVVDAVAEAGELAEAPGAALLHLGAQLLRGPHGVRHRHHVPLQKVDGEVVDDEVAGVAVLGSEVGFEPGEGLPEDVEVGCGGVVLELDRSLRRLHERDLRLYR